MNCKDCIHFETCLIRDELSDGESEVVSVLECTHFKDRARFVELPNPIRKGSKLYYYINDENEEPHVCEIADTVTAVLEEGFFVSTRINSNGKFNPHKDDFYRWDSIGLTYFHTYEEAALHALKERENNG